MFTCTDAYMGILTKGVVGWWSFEVIYDVQVRRPKYGVLCAHLADSISLVFHTKFGVQPNTIHFPELE